MVDTCILSDPDTFKCFEVEKIQAPGLEEHLAKFPPPTGARFVIPLDLDKAVSYLDFVIIVLFFR